MTEHIRIGDIRPRIQYVGNGAVKAFAFPFPVFAASDLAVYLGEAAQAEGFAVTGAGQSGGGCVTFAVAPAEGVVVTLSRAVPVARTTDFQEGGVFRANVINEELDRIVCMAQQLGEDIDRALKRPATSTSGAALDLPEPVPGRALKFAADGALRVSDLDPDAAQAAAAAAATAAQSARQATEAARDAALDAASASAQTAAAGVSASMAGQVSLAQAAAATAQAARDVTLDALDHFDDRYLGAKAANPVVDNDGDPLLAGALYFDSTLGVMKIYTGAAWVAAYVSGTDYLLILNGLSEIAAAGPAAQAAARANLGAPAAADLAALKGVPQVLKSANALADVADRGKCYDTTGAELKLPQTAGWTPGDCVSITNLNATAMTITGATGVTLRLAGTATTGARTLAGYGVATARFVADNTWFVSGAGLS